MVRGGFRECLHRWFLDFLATGKSTWLQVTLGTWVPVARILQEVVGPVTWHIEKAFACAKIPEFASKFEWLKFVPRGSTGQVMSPCY